MHVNATYSLRDFELQTKTDHNDDDRFAPSPTETGINASKQTLDRQTRIGYCTNGYEGDGVNINEEETACSSSQLDPSTSNVHKSALANIKYLRRRENVGDSDIAQTTGKCG